MCAGLEGGVFKEFLEPMCDRSLKPADSAACFERPCSKWFTTSWSQVKIMDMTVSLFPLISRVLLSFVDSGSYSWECSKLYVTLETVHSLYTLRLFASNIRWLKGSVNNSLRKIYLIYLAFFSMFVVSVCPAVQ